MSPTVRSLLLKSKINGLLVCAYFLHSATAILLLLLIGQVVSQGDSTKAKLLKIILPTGLNDFQLWLWVGSLIALKFIATFAKNYFYPMNLFRIQKILRQSILTQSKHSNFEPLAESELNRFSKAFVKGVLYLLADIFLLGFILLLLFKLNVYVAQCWLLFIVVGLCLRSIFERISPMAKTELKKAMTGVSKHWKQLSGNQHDIEKNGYFEREMASYQKLERDAYNTVRRHSLKVAWTAGFFPVYFLVFLFVLAASFDESAMMQGNVLQLLLLIIYSQSAIMRLFKVPVHWKEINELQVKFKL